MEAYLHMRIIEKNVRLSLRNVSVEIGVHIDGLELIIFTEEELPLLYHNRLL